MIVFFGPAGAGKSVQGQMLAARMGWRWLSSGQLLRDTRDPAMLEYLQTGKLVSDDMVIKIFEEAFKHAHEVKNIILDGFPRKLSQAEWLVENKEQHGQEIQLAVVVEVPREEVVKRMQIRGRADDTPEAIDERLSIYRKEMYPILAFLTEHNIPVVHIDGVGSVGQVHDRIAAEISHRGIE